MYRTFGFVHPLLFAPLPEGGRKGGVHFSEMFLPLMRKKGTRFRTFLTYGESSGIRIHGLQGHNLAL